MTKWARPVQALYDALGKWQLVADACNGAELTHSAGYYQQVATGRIKEPNAETRSGIEAAPEYQESLLKRDFSRPARGGLTIRFSLWLRLRELKTSRNWTWDKLLEKALELLRREYDEGSEE